MLRRDYFLRMAEKFGQMLARIADEMEAGQHTEAGLGLDEAFNELMGAGAEQICRMSDTELLARLTESGPTQSVPDKVRILVALLQQTGLLHAAENREEQAHACWLKAMNLLLNLQLEDLDSDFQQFIPTLDMLRDQLRDVELPLQTLAALWRHYERIGAYARAEDTLFALLEAQPDNPDLLSEAKAFYERLLQQSDHALEEGNLPRAEVSAGLEELSRKSAL
jgi:tetratricopeptide (TPR) repeat protein